MADLLGFCAGSQRSPGMGVHRAFGMDRGCRSELDQLFSRVNHLLRETSDQLTGKFFEHARGGQQLVRQNRGFE